MRLFIAILFHEEIKNSLVEGINLLQECSEKGSFTKEENLHLTLVFIGETTNLAAVKTVMDKLTAPIFDCTVGGMGKFKRNTGDLFWVGVDKSLYLTRVYDQLRTGLQQARFSIEDREFKPHITLGREVKLKKEVHFEIPKKTMQVTKISLMKSERINGKLTYTEIYTKELKGEQNEKGNL